MAHSGGGGGGGKKRSGHRGGGGGKRPRYGGDRPSTPAGPFVTLQALRKERALLVTCEVGRERQAVKELRVILDRFVEEHQASEDGEVPKDWAAAAAAASVRDALQQEIAELRKAKGTGATIQAVDTGCKGTTGVSIPADFPLGPVAAAVRMLEEAQAGHSSSRSVVKLMPMEKLCYGGDLNGLKQELQALLKDRGVLNVDDGEEGGAAAAAAATAEEPKPTYMISLNRRNFQAHSREEIYDAVGAVVGDRWKVDLKNPERVIVMEAIRGTIGFGYCERWGEFKKYNLRQLQDQARAAAGGNGKKNKPANKEAEEAAEAGAEAEADD